MHSNEKPNQLSFLEYFVAKNWVLSCKSVSSICYFLTFLFSHSAKCAKRKKNGHVREIWEVEKNLPSFWYFSQNHLTFSRGYCSSKQQKKRANWVGERLRRRRATVSYYASRVHNRGRLIQLPRTAVVCVSPEMRKVRDAVVASNIGGTKGAKATLHFIRNITQAFLPHSSTEKTNTTWHRLFVHDCKQTYLQVAH